MPKRDDKQQERESSERPRAQGSARSGQTPVGKSPPACNPTTGGGELRRFEPVSDELVLAAVDRAERHRTNQRAGIWWHDIVAHLGFVRSGWTTRQLRPQLNALEAAGMLSKSRRHSTDVWALTDSGREYLTSKQQAGAVGELPESPQHRTWRHTRASAAERIGGFRAQVRQGADETARLLESRQRVRSDAWLQLAERLGPASRGLGLATYCLYEWPEPEDARADIDDYEDPGDDQLAPDLVAKLRWLRQYRRNPHWKYDEEGTGQPLAGLLITVPGEMLSELRHGLHTVLGDATQGISQTTERFGRERHPEWYAEHRAQFERTWALLDLIGWGEPKQPAALQIDLGEHHQAVGEALDVRLLIASDDLKEADKVDAERAEQGDPPKRDATTTRVHALREFATAVKDLIDRG